MTTNNFPGIGFVTNGKDHNYFKKYSVTETVFGAASVDGYQPCLMIPFPTQSVMFLNEGSGVVEFSFNGTTVHGELDSTKVTAGLTFDNRIVTKIWFRVKAGSTGPIVVSANAWARM